MLEKVPGVGLERGSFDSVEKEIRWDDLERGAPSFRTPLQDGAAKGLSWIEPDSMDSSSLLKEPRWSQHTGNLELFTRL